MALTAVILAAGKSTRMKSKRPKPLHELCGRPMLDYILRACWEAGCSKAILVVGYGKDEVIAQFGSDPRIVFVEQTEQLGTGHAVRVCEHELRQVKGSVVILTGDVPLVRPEVLTTLVKGHHDDKADASMATAVLEDPTGYGRIVRDGKGDFVQIVEQIDCTPEQREIREVFPSFYCVKAEELLFALSRLTNNNRKKEYYLTDIYSILRNAGRRVLALQCVTSEDVIAPNSRQELALADAVMQERIQRQHREAGVSVSSAGTVYIEDGASIGPDTVIHPFSFIGRDAVIGAECVIGPFAVVPRSSVVQEGTTIAGNVSAETTILQ